MNGERFSVRQAAIGDEPILRELRLRAMAESPEAFGSTFKRESARTLEDWRRWMSPGATFILTNAAGPAGMVAGQHDADESDVVHLMAMWVDPASRRSGSADALVTAVVDWAAEERARVVRLHVITSNARARRCYERNGFQLTGDETVRAGDGRIEVRMERTLREGMQGL